MLTLILKASNGCNLRCSYCSVGDKKITSTLTDKQMRDALHFFAEYAITKGEHDISVIFHGGEPMLLPAQSYRICMEEMVTLFPQLHFRFSMQTNGTLLTQEFIDLFSDYDMDVGVSLDGSQPIHDGQRKDIHGQGTYDLVMQHIIEMKKRQIPVAALMVLTKPALEMDLGFLKQLDQLHISIKINPLLNMGEVSQHSDLMLQPGDYARFLIRVFRYLIRENLELTVSPLAPLLFGILNGRPPQGCIYHSDCTQKFICIDSECNIYPCGRFSDGHQYCIGTLAEGITEQGHKIQKQLLLRRGENLSAECKNCRALPICNGGCNACVLLQQDNAVSPYICEDMRILWDFLHHEGLDLFQQQLVLEKKRIIEWIEKA